MSRLETRAIEALGPGLLKGLGRTLRIEVEGDGPLRELRRAGCPVILAFWHSRILPLAYVHRAEGITVLVSRNRDGEYIARVIRKLGFELARGSASRGGASGLRDLVRTIRKGGDVGITPDGSRGPTRKFKPGALLAAQLTGAAIVPLAAGGRAVWRARSWDRMIVPKPFARIRVVYADPYFIPRETSRDELEAHARSLERILDRITDRSDGLPEDRDGPSPDPRPGEVSG